MIVRLAAVLVALAVAGGLFVAGPAVAHQGASPTAEPDGEDRPSILADLPGIEEAVARDFDASGMRLVGTLVFRFAAARFDEPESAEAAIPVVLDRYLDRLGDEAGDVSGVRAASVRDLGDETVARAGEIVTPGEDEPDLTVAILAVRRGALLQLFVGAALAGDPLADVADIAEAGVEREPGGDATPTGDDGMRTGGLWDVLPRLDDLPEGFVFVEERIPGEETPEAD